ncbi:GNAT family N-acetyltransferase [Massilia oculi]|uniref:GNAT family N-acetyltransferase n=1 Tax=Massilia oculi TaxID=945844 RepID=UPI001AAFA57B|nr:GNAT family N-acetyltransferase [Massilia oculi]
MGIENTTVQAIPTNFWIEGNPPFASHADKNIVSSRFYENAIPDFAEAALERLYANIYCTLTRIGIYERLDDIHTFAAADEHDVVLLILFRIDRDTVRIVNQQVALSAGDLAYFAANVFSRYPAARRIEGYALDTRIDASTFSFPVQVLPQLEENVAQLPPSADAYMRQLGKRTRELMRRSMRKCAAQFPSCRFEVLSTHRITPRHVRELVRLTDQRMGARNAAPYVENADIERMVRLAHSHGYLGIMLIDDSIVAASLFFKVGMRHFLHLVGHDPRFDAYRLGRQVTLHTIFHAIAIGGRELWMMGGHHDWKSHFLARRKTLGNVTIYRSRVAALVCWRTLLRNAARSRLHDLRLLVARVQARDGAGGRLLGGSFAGLRHARKGLRRLRFLLAGGAGKPCFRREGGDTDA